MFTNSVGLLFLCAALQIIISPSRSCDSECRVSTPSRDEKWEYTLVKRPLAWIDAFQACKAEAKDLAAIESFEIFDTVTKMIRQTAGNSTSVWTSGTDMYKEGEFTWMNSGKKLYYYSESMWGPGQPDNGGQKIGHKEDCIELGAYWRGMGHRLNDIDCTSKSFFVCQKKIEEKNSCPKN